MSYTTTELLASIRSAGSIPDGLFSDSDLLKAASARARSFVIPQIIKAREGYYEWDIDESVSASGTYRIPSRAIGSSVANLALIDGDTRADVAWIDEEELANYAELNYSAVGAYIKGHKIYLVPATSHGYATLRKTINLRLGRFVAVSDAAQITAINTGTGVVTCSTVPSSWTTSNSFDLMQEDPHFDWYAIEATATAVTTGSGGTVTFGSLPTWISDLTVGDWISLTDETPIIQMPVEFHEVLAQDTSNFVMRSKMDAESLKAGTDSLAELLDGAGACIEPRWRKEGRKVKNRTGMLRRQGG